MTGNDKLRYAIEELNRYIRFIDNFSWLLASMIMAGTVIIISKLYEILLQPDSIPNWIVVLTIDVTVILVWEWYIRFLRGSVLRATILSERANLYEKKLGIDVIPAFIDNPDGNIKIEFRKGQKCISFIRFMGNIRLLVWSLLAIACGSKLIFALISYSEPRDNNHDIFYYIFNIF